MKQRHIPTFRATVPYISASTFLNLDIYACKPLFILGISSNKHSRRLVIVLLVGTADSETLVSTVLVTVVGRTLGTIRYLTGWNQVFLALVLAVCLVTTDAVDCTTHLVAVPGHWCGWDGGADAQVDVSCWPPLGILLVAVELVSGGASSEVMIVLVSVEAFVAARAGSSRTAVALPSATSLVAGGWQSGSRGNWTCLQIYNLRVRICSFAPGRFAASPGSGAGRSITAGYAVWPEIAPFTPMRLPRAVEAVSFVEVSALAHEGAARTHDTGGVRVAVAICLTLHVIRAWRCTGTTRNIFDGNIGIIGQIEVTASHILSLVLDGEHFVAFCGKSSSIVVKVSNVAAGDTMSLVDSSGHQHVLGRN